MTGPVLTVVKMIVVVSLVVFLKSCSSGANMAGGSGKKGSSSSKAEVKSGKGGDSANGSSQQKGNQDLASKGKASKNGEGKPDTELFGKGSGDLGGDSSQAGASAGEEAQSNEDLLKLDPQFKNLSNEQFRVDERVYKHPLDLIIAIDTSGSMGEEAIKVQQNVSILTQAFAKVTGLDYHIYVVSNSGALAGVDPAKVSMVNRAVGSNNALGILSELITGTVVPPKPIRAETKKAFVIVTDDNAENITAGAFTTTIQSDPRFRDKTSVNGLIWIEGISQTSATCDGAAPGAEYITLAKAKETAGMVYDLCANDWNPLFVDLGKRLIQQSVVLEYPLKAKADPNGAFAVGVNGTKLDPSSYKFDPIKNAIIFAEGKAPPVGSEVIVGFKAL